MRLDPARPDDLRVLVRVLNPRSREDGRDSVASGLPAVATVALTVTITITFYLAVRSQQFRLVLRREQLGKLAHPAVLVVFGLLLDEAEFFVFLLGCLI